MILELGNTIHQLLKQYNIYPSKRKGQHFLISENTANRIFELLEIKSTDLIIDVGAGLGVLSIHLAEMCAGVAALEFDSQLHEILKSYETLVPNLYPLNVDARKYDYSNSNLHSMDIKTPGEIKLLGNLPYYATSPILARIQNTGTCISKMVFLLQNEVAERIVARPGSKLMGMNTIRAQFFWNVRADMVVGTGAFLPKPRINSRLVLAETKPNLPLPEKSIDPFFKFLSPAFQKKRKKLRNIFKSCNFTTEQMDRFQSVLIEHGRSLDDRPENISLDQWLQLFKLL